MTAMDSTPALTIRDLVKSFTAPSGQRTEVLRIPSFQLEAGQHRAIRGESGLGKTTLMHIIAGILEPDSGFVAVGGTEVTGLSEARRDRLRAERIGYVFQTFNLLQGLSALENVMLGLESGHGLGTHADAGPQRRRRRAAGVAGLPSWWGTRPSPSNWSGNLGAAPCGPTSWMGRWRGSSGSRPGN